MSRTSSFTPSRLRTAAPLFAALGDPTRFQLILRLAATGPESIARLSANAAVSRQAIAKHLGVLARAGVVQGRRQGREHLWQLQPKRLADARICLERISRQWDDALDRLQQFVDD